MNDREEKRKDGGERRPGAAAGMIGVHVMSEHVFCPRAGLIAYESGEDEGQEEKRLGPRLGGFYEYDEHRFAEAIAERCAEMRLWLTLSAPAGFLALVAWRVISPLAGAVALGPLLYLVARFWDSTRELLALVRERRMLRKARVVEIDMRPEKSYEVNWWSLRKAGFDCLKLHEALRDRKDGVAGKPWRLLTKGNTVGIPVFRKHRGERVWHEQHVMRIAAYCRLIERCEGRKAPFGVLMFAGSYDCVVIPNSQHAQRKLDRVLSEAREFVWHQGQGKFIPAAPEPGRCRKCPLGRPRVYRLGETDTELDGVAIAPLRTRAKNGQLYHSVCGDRFTWVPPHERARELGIVE